MSTMSGIRNWSGPKRIRHKTEHNTPVSAGMRSLPDTHCSVKEAINRAVVENSMPFVENGRTLPRRLPRMLHVTQ